ncbi:MAG: CvpA family protein [Candidatus Kerfeldbacteria bacterium]|nr:CvpA family protein [Candidatus Kerfeldbacteria bacterium]
MGTLDLIILILFLGFIGSGFWFGFIHTLGTIIGVVVGVIAAGQLYDGVSSFFQMFLLKPNIADLVAFAVIFIATSQLVGWVAKMFDSGFKLVRLFPFVSSANRLAGAMLGFIEGALVIGVVLFVASNFELSPSINQAISDSVLAGLFMTIASILTPLIPASLKIEVIS